MPRLLLVLPILALSACSSATEAVNKGVTPAKLKTDTAKYLNVSPRSVAILNIRQNVLGTSYQAKAGRAVYNCNQFRAAITCERYHG